MSAIMIATPVQLQVAAGMETGIFTPDMRISRRKLREKLMA